MAATSVSLATYGYDATLLEGRADAAVFPTTTEQVAAVLRYCHGHGIPVTPRGHGTDLSGGSIPLGGVVMVLTCMDRILSIDPVNRVAVVQPGVVNMDLQRAVDPLGLMYAPDPASQKVCSLGGNVGEGAGGMRGFKYGVTKDHVIGLKLVLADGEVWQVGGALEPIVPGVDWTGLIMADRMAVGASTRGCTPGAFSWVTCFLPGPYTVSGPTGGARVGGARTPQCRRSARMGSAGCALGAGGPGFAQPPAGRGRRSGVAGPPGGVAPAGIRGSPCTGGIACHVEGSGSADGGPGRAPRGTGCLAGTGGRERGETGGRYPLPRGYLA